ncbi:MAG: sulfatase-like hydrolase/transferase [Bacteroidetes bacterium]|nr:sulfatase-like hydrolase/transferase [Bacteroidota bacterium]
MNQSTGKIMKPMVMGVAVLAISYGFLSCKSMESKPNILLIVSDDQGYADFSAYGGLKEAQTPNLDRLAESGVRFTNAYVTMSICSPSRCGFLTGRYQQRWGVYNYGAKLPQNEITIAEQLKEAGYITGMVGKSHYGGYNGPKAQEFPLNHGFDEFFGREGGTMDYLRHTKKDTEPFTPYMANHLGIGPWYVNDNVVDQTGYSTDLITDRALSFIEENKKHPFFLFVSFNEVHGPTHQLPDEDLKKLGLKKFPDWEPVEGTWDEYLEWVVDTIKPETPQGRERYLYHLKRLDEAVGKIQKKLEETDLIHNTIIIFFSDNGGSPSVFTNNAPLRGYKFLLEEGGIRVPFVISWPGKISSNKLYEPMISTLDIFPTIHAALEIEMPANREYDGVNLLPFLNADSASVPHETLFWTGFSLRSEKPHFDEPESALARHYRQIGGDRYGWAIRHKNWKLRYFGETDKYALYDLEKDIGESENLIEQYPELADKLKNMFAEWHNQVATEESKN